MGFSFAVTVADASPVQQAVQTAPAADLSGVLITLGIAVAVLLTGEAFSAWGARRRHHQPRRNLHTEPRR